jgi:hypothetical protein
MSTTIDPENVDRLARRVSGKRSNGQRAFFAPYDSGHLAPHRDVTACQEWVNVTGDSQVAVDTKTGQIVGCEDEGYPHIRNVAKNPPVWLHLFHGRTDPEGKDMPDGWGFNGPTIGPLHYVHVTYMCDVKYGFQDQHDAAKFGLPDEGHFKIVGDLIEHDGRFYGDFSINAFPSSDWHYKIVDGDVEHPVFQATMQDALEQLKKFGPGAELIDLNGDAAPVVARNA